MMIFISLFVVVVLMTLFTWIYNSQRRNNVSDATVEIDQIDDHRRSDAISKNLFDIFSSHMIYAINILTNQGINVLQCFELSLALGKLIYLIQ